MFKYYFCNTHVTDDDESAGSSSRAVPTPVGSLREGRGRATPPETRGREAVESEGERSRDPNHAVAATHGKHTLTPD